MSVIVQVKNKDDLEVVAEVGPFTDFISAMDSPIVETLKAEHDFPARTFVSYRPQEAL